MKISGALTANAGFCAVVTLVLSSPLLCKAGLVVTKISGPPTANVVVKQTKQDGSGCTSIRYCDGKSLLTSTRTGDSIPAPFRAPDRDLGQTFTAPKDMKLDAIAIRVGPDGNSGISVEGQRIAVQLLKVSGKPVIHDAGTSVKSDDWSTGETFTQVAVAENGSLPKGANTGGTYLKFDLTGSHEIQLKSGEIYAYMLMLMDKSPSAAKLCLANTMYGGSSYTGGHAIRREGGCGPSGKPEYRPDFCPWAQRLAQQPGTFGHPDVCTYRDHVFFIIEGSGSTSVMSRPIVTALQQRNGARAEMFDMRGARIAQNMHSAGRPGISIVKYAVPGLQEIALQIR